MHGIMNLKLVKSRNIGVRCMRRKYTALVGCHCQSKTRRKVCFSVTFFSKNLTWTNLGSNPGLHGERPEPWEGHFFNLERFTISCVIPAQQPRYSSRFSSTFGTETCRRFISKIFSYSAQQ